MEKEILTDREVLLLRRKLDLLLRTGKLLMESAADTNRIERNMKRVAAFMGIPEEKLHLDIRWTMIMVNVSDETHSFSKFQKCEKHQYDDHYGGQPFVVEGYRTGLFVGPV